MQLPFNDGPYSVGYNGTTTGGGTSILANDNGTSLTVASVTGTSICATFPCTVNTTHGSVTVASNGTFSYSPNNGYYGTDSFTYVASDGTSPTNSATVSFNVQKPAAPVAVNDSGTTMVSTALDTTALVAGQSVNNPNILTNDSGTGITLTSVTGSGAACVAFPCTITTTHGNTVVALGGTYKYTPTAGYSGPDSFTYQITDSASQTANPVEVQTSGGAALVAVTASGRMGIGTSTPGQLLDLTNGHLRFTPLAAPPAPGVASPPILEAST